MADLNNLEAVVLEKIVKVMKLSDIDTSDFPYTAPIFGSDSDGTEKCLELDSIDALELAVLIYDEWGINVEAEDMPKLRNIKAIADFIKEKLNEKLPESN